MDLINISGIRTQSSPESRTTVRASSDNWAYNWAFLRDVMSTPASLPVTQAPKMRVAARASVARQHALWLWFENPALEKEYCNYISDLYRGEDRGMAMLIVVRKPGYHVVRCWQPHSSLLRTLNVSMRRFSCPEFLYSVWHENHEV